MTRALIWGAVCLVVPLGSTGSRAAEESGEELTGLVVNLLGDKDKDVRALGLEQVRTSAKGPVATRQFAAQLAKLSPDAQVGLLGALADRGDMVARPAVLDVLAASREEGVRVAAISALGYLGQPADIKQLVSLLAKSSRVEKAAALSSLVRLRGETVSLLLVAEMKQAAPRVRAEVIDILATRRARDTLTEILPAAADADPAVRGAAMRALGQLAGGEHLPGMVQGVLKAEAGGEREAAERSVMLVCNRLGDAGRRAGPLLAALGELPAADRTAMLPTLGRVGGPAALKVVEAAVADADPKTHAIGLRALCNWPDASIATRLLELAEADPHPEHQAMALGAVIRVAPLPDKRTAGARLELLKKAMAMCSMDSQRNLVLKRASAIRTAESLRFIAPYIDQPQVAQQACESVVELAHHRELREANKSEFDRVLSKVMQTSKDATVIDRANRYQKNQTWARPTTAEEP